MKRLILVAAACAALCCARAEGVEELVKLADPLLPPGAGRVNSMPADVGTAKKVEVDGAMVMHVEITQPISQAWRALIGKDFADPLRKGDVCMVTLRARTLQSADESGLGYAVVNVQVNADPWEKTMTEGFKPGREWTSFAFPFVAKFDIPQGKGGFNISLAYQAQKLEIADTQIWKFPAGFDSKRLPMPAKTYVGREADAPWRTEALERIEKIRRADLSVEVVDSSGEPVQNAQVKIRQERHIFGFGSAVHGARMSQEDADSVKYRAVVDELFSRIVLENDLKTFAVGTWTNTEKKNATFSREIADKAINWARTRDLSVRGHYLSWGNTEPWSERLEKEGLPREIHARILEHARTVLDFAGDRICEWDAINHPVPFSRVLPDVLGPDIFATLMKDFRGMTKTPLWINEDLIELNRATRYFKALEDLKACGATIDGAGLMSHFREGNLGSIAQLQGYLDRLTQIVPHVEVTEYDLETQDDCLHADHMRDMLILHYAHPACTGFMMWGFWEKQHWRHDGAMFRADWTERPAVAVWRDLVKTKWWTNESLTTDANGKLSTKIWEGIHKVSVVKDGKAIASAEISIASGGAAETKITVP